MLSLTKSFALRTMSTSSKLRLPAIISDIDGVVYRGGKRIQGSDKVIQNCLTPFVNPSTQQHQYLPFCLLTNGGGQIEPTRANKINKIIYEGEDIEAKDFSKPLLTENHVILCNTPFSDPLLVEKYKDSFVLVTGLGNLIEITERYGYPKAIDIEELYSIYPESCPSLFKTYSNEFRAEKTQALMQRMSKLGYNSVDELKKDLKFAAIMLLSDAVNLEMNIQLMCDLLASNDGRIDGGLYSDTFQRQNKEKEPQKVDFYVSNPDLEFADTFVWPRHGQGILIHTLQAVYEANYPHLAPCDIILYGKPTPQTYDFTKRRLTQQFEEQGVEITNYYMIGDNPMSDIRGGNNNDCITILTRSGVFSGVSPSGEPLENDPNNPAHYVVDNMYEAYKLIIEKEGIQDLVKFEQ